MTTTRDERPAHDDPDNAQGFMTCAQGKAPAQGYWAIADVMNAVGLTAEAVGYAGKTLGVRQGARD